METTFKIDKNAKYIIIYGECDTYEFITGEHLLNKLKEEDKELSLTPKDQIFKLGEEYKVETKLVKVNK